MTNQSEIPRGPEDVPLKKIWEKEHYLIVTFIDIKSGRKIRNEKINYGDREARLWLGRSTYWATTNGYMVQTCAEVDYVVEV